MATNKKNEEGEGTTMKFISYVAHAMLTQQYLHDNCYCEFVKSFDRLNLKYCFVWNLSRFNSVSKPHLCT